jgi:hypothetical protein
MVNALIVGGNILEVRNHGRRSRHVRPALEALPAPSGGQQPLTEDICDEKARRFIDYHMPIARQAGLFER